MLDRKTSKKPIDHIRKHLTITMNAPISIKDEAYIQVLKQIKENPDEEKTKRGWNFLAILSACYSPSLSLYYSILNYLLYEIKHNEDRNIIRRANYIFIRLVKVFGKKRKNIPSNNEITHIENMKTMMIPVYFFSESLVYMPVESYTTVKDLKTNLMKKMKFSQNKIQFYCLEEIKLKKDKDISEERFMIESNILCDDFSLWEKQVNEGNKNNESIDFKIYLKILIYYQYSENDIDTTTMTYIQVRLFIT